MSGWSSAQRIDFLQLLDEQDRRRRGRRMLSMYPDRGQYRRELYAKHLRFFALGSKHEPGVGCPKGCDGSAHAERLFMAANRVGKTWGAGGYETALHLTGLYPDWWTGAKFDRPVQAWAAGETRQTTRDISQLALIGTADIHDMVNLGTGLIPSEFLLRVAPMPGVPGATEQVRVRHKGGGVSVLGFKSYDQGRESFQGTSKEVVWLDEECPEDIYAECLTRTMTVRGHVLSTFTPLRGLTPLVVSFLESKNGTTV